MLVPEAWIRRAVQELLELVGLNPSTTTGTRYLGTNGV